MLLLKFVLGEQHRCGVFFLVNIDEIVKSLTLILIFASVYATFILCCIHSGKNMVYHVLANIKYTSEHAADKGCRQQIKHCQKCANLQRALNNKLLEDGESLSGNEVF